MKERDNLVDLLIDEFGIYNKKILRAFREVDRREFLPEIYRKSAFINRALPVMNGQTSTKPSTIARFLSLLMPFENKTILELGTGSGYQCAVLSRLYKRVISWEVDKELHEWASKRLSKLSNVECFHGNLLKEENVPKFDSAIFSFATYTVPESIISALNDPGDILAPLIKGKNQFLLHIKKENDKITNTMLNYERFVRIRGISHAE